MSQLAQLDTRRICRPPSPRSDAWTPSRRFLAGCAFHSLSNVFGLLGSAAKRRHYDAPRKSRGSRLPAARAFYSFLVFVFWVFLLWLVGSFLVDAMQYASWGSVSFVSVESACRHYGVSMTSPMTSLTSLGVMFRNLEESRSRSLHVRQNIHAVHYASTLATPRPVRGPTQYFLDY